ncbi:hypothetical protein SLS56_011888 [Neofusicoccum ribis]|uniref:Zn(2)-C6 fungal-type domain-containing protein n=1 Tax=Neofusicoccum ribis TaxID=45134 RepID=A0ABR3SAF3_9PEZI
MHQGRRLCACEFCNARFHRRDILRRHYLACKSRGDRPVPEQQRPGRRKSACDRCASFKLACDLRRPCQACESASSACTWRRVQQRAATPEPGTHTSSPSAPEDLEPAAEDRPPAVPQPRAPRLAVDTANIRMPFLAALCEPGRQTVPEVFGFLSVPPEPLPRPPARDPWSRASGGDPASSLSGGEVASGPDSGVDIGLPDQCSLLGRSPSAGGAQQPSLQDQTKDRLRELVMRLTDAYISLPRDHAARAGVRVEDAYSFFTPPNLRTFVHTYFHHFHPHCPITHRPSFDARTASLPLVLAICLAGALYSSCPDAAAVARSLLGLAEECVFGEPCFRQLANRPAGARSAQGGATMHLQAVQAAVIIACVQNIEGDAATPDCVAALCASQTPETPPLGELLRTLLHDDWCEESLRGMTEFDFFVAVNGALPTSNHGDTTDAQTALLVMIWTSRASILSCRTAVDSIDRALARWRVAWDARLRVPGSQQFKRLGFMKHALDYWWLAQLLLHFTLRRPESPSQVDGENDFRNPPFHDEDMSYVRSLIAHVGPGSSAML